MTSAPAPRSALAALLRELERDGRASLAWAVEHVPDGDVERPYRESQEPAVMLALLAHCGERAALLRASFTCARAALTRLPSGERPAREVLDAYEGWYAGRVTSSGAGSAYKAFPRPSSVDWRGAASDARFFAAGVVDACCMLAEQLVAEAQDRARATQTVGAREQFLAIVRHAGESLVDSAHLAFATHDVYAAVGARIHVGACPLVARLAEALDDAPRGDQYTRLAVEARRATPCSVLASLAETVRGAAPAVSIAALVESARR